MIAIQINSTISQGCLWRTQFSLHCSLIVVLSVYLSAHHRCLYPHFIIPPLCSRHFSIHWLASFGRTATVCVPLCVAVCLTWPHMHTDEISCCLQPLAPWFHESGTMFAEPLRRPPRCVALSSHMLSFLPPETRDSGYWANSSPLRPIIITLSLSCRRRSGATFACVCACVCVE